MPTNLYSSPWLLGPVAGTAVVLLLLLATGKVPFRYNVRNLAVRWPTTLLTGLAVTLVVFLLTVMLAFVVGMYRLTNGSGQPGNVMVLSDGATDELFSNLGYSDSSTIERERATEDPNGQPLAQPAGVERIDRNGKPVYLCSRETYLVVNQTIPVAPGQPERRRFVQVRGVVDPEISGLVHGVTLYPGGQWFSAAGVQSGDKSGDDSKAQDVIQAVIGQGVARVLGADQHREQLEVGDGFEMGDRKWIVVGILQSAGTTFDSEIWTKQSIVGPMFRKESYTSIVLRTADAASGQALAKHLTKKYKDAAVQAQPEPEYYAKLGETNKQFLAAIIFLAVFMALGGFFGVMNTMFAAVSQRSKDIGVLRILGFSRLNVQASFLLESLVLALAGGAAGCALGSLVHGTKAASIVGSGQGGGKFVVLEMVVSGDIIAVGLALSLAMGLFGGLLPSIRAMLVRPLESLR